jgi:hypothetical protein
MPTSAAKRRLQDELQSGKLDFKGKMQLALINERNGCTVAEIAARHPDVTDRMVRSWEEERLNHDLLIAASLVYERHWTKPAFVAAGVDFDPEGIRMLENMLLYLRKSFFTRVKEPIEETSEKTEARFVYELRGSRPQIKKFIETKTWEDYIKIFDFKGRR